MEILGREPNWLARVALRSREWLTSEMNLASSGQCWESSAMTAGTLQMNMPAFHEKDPARRNSSARSGLGFSRKRWTS